MRQNSGNILNGFHPKNFAGLFCHVYFEENYWSTKFLGWKLIEKFQLYFSWGHTDWTILNFQNVWMWDFMNQQSLMLNLVQVLIFRQEIWFQEDLWQWFDNDFRMSIAIHFIEKNEYLVFEKNKAFVGLRSCDNVKKGHSSNMWTGQGFKYRELVRPAGLSSRLV